MLGWSGAGGGSGDMMRSCCCWCRAELGCPARSFCRLDHTPPTLPRSERRVSARSLSLQQNCGWHQLGSGDDVGNMAKLHHNITSQKTCPERPRVFSASVDLHGNLFTMLCKFLFLIDKHILNTILILFSCFKIQSQRQSYHRSRRQEERQDDLVLRYATY